MALFILKAFRLFVLLTVHKINDQLYLFQAHLTIRAISSFHPKCLQAYITLVTLFTVPPIIIIAFIVPFYIDTANLSSQER